MDSYIAIGIYLCIVTEVGGLVVLALQVAAYRHHRHTGLLVLIASSLIGLAYGLLASLPYFAVNDPRFYTTTFALACAALALPALVLSVVGVALLLKSYRQLADANLQAQARIAELEAGLPCPALPTRALPA